MSSGSATHGVVCPPPGEWQFFEDFGTYGCVGADMQILPIENPFNLSPADAELLMGTVALMLVTAFCFRTLRRFIGQVLQ